jgi:hypothetical protein
MNLVKRLLDTEARRRGDRAITPHQAGSGICLNVTSQATTPSHFPVKSLDRKVRKAIKKGTAPLNVVAETLSKLQALL